MKSWIDFEGRAGNVQIKATMDSSLGLFSVQLFWPSEDVSAFYNFPLEDVTDHKDEVLTALNRAAEDANCPAISCEEKCMRKFDGRRWFCFSLEVVK